jgi:hypothetical protein
VRRSSVKKKLRIVLVKFPNFNAWIIVYSISIYSMQSLKIICLLYYMTCRHNHVVNILVGVHYTSLKKLIPFPAHHIMRAYYIAIRCYRILKDFFMCEC